MNGRSWKVERAFQAERETACVEPKEKVNGAGTGRRGSILEVRLGCWQRLVLCAFSIKLKVWTVSPQVHGGPPKSVKLNFVVGGRGYSRVLFVFLEITSSASKDLN